MINKKIIYGVDFLLILGSLIGLVFVFGYAQPLVIAPIDGFESSDTAVLFSFEKANLILIDENLDFSSPNEYYVEDNLVINLKPGIYYWKVQGIRASDVRQFTLKSEVNLKIKDVGDEYEVINGGNTRLNVEVYEDGRLRDNLILDVDESEKAEGDKFIGGQNE